MPLKFAGQLICLPRQTVLGFQQDRLEDNESFFAWSTLPVNIKANVAALFALSVAGLLAGSRVPDQYLFGRALDYDVIHGDSGIPRRPLQTIHAEFAELARTRSDVADWVEYGRSGSEKPLMALRVMKKDHSTAARRPAILISEAIHGNEYLHITDRLPFELMKQDGGSSQFARYVENGGVAYFVPVVNPDGYSVGRRGNASGADLNRDFSIRAAGNQGFRQPETRAITSFIESEVRSQNLAVEATMEYHCCIGGLIHPWAWTPAGLTGEALQRHRDFGEMVTDIFSYPYGTVNDILGYSAVGGSDDYYLETYGQRAFSFEGQNGREAGRLADHVRLWERFLETLPTAHQK